MEICNCYEDSTYQEIIVQIVKKYEIDKIEANKDTIIIDSDFPLFQEELRCLKKLRIINNDILDKSRFTILRNYIKRKSYLEGISGIQLIELIEKLIEKHKRNKELIQIIEQYWYSIPEHHSRFYSYDKLDMWHMIELNWNKLYNKLLTKNIFTYTENIEQINRCDKYLYWPNDDSIRLRGYQYKLSQYVFWEYPWQVYYKAIELEEYIYGKVNQSKSALKSLTVEINKKWKEVWYNLSILSYEDEWVVVNI